MELKPCPFCGGTQIKVYPNPKNELRYFGIEQYKISCLKCAAQLFRGKKEEAVNAWNRRANDEHTLALYWLRKIADTIIESEEKK